VKMRYFSEPCRRTPNADR